MKISKMIQILQECQKQHGDISVQRSVFLEKVNGIQKILVIRPDMWEQWNEYEIKGNSK